MQFLETSLRDRDRARRIGRRADWIVQAIVGGDRAIADVAISGRPANSGAGRAARKRSSPAPASGWQ